jgi:hypothetical protein
MFREKDIPDDCRLADGFCEIVNGADRSFAVNRGTGAFVAPFGSIQLKSVIRPDRGKNQELVTEQKYAFVFYVTVTAFGHTVKLRVSTCFFLGCYYWLFTDLLFV